MKITRIIAAALVMIMLCGSFALFGCAQKVVSNVTVKFIDGEGKEIGSADVAVNGTMDNPPTALGAAQEALAFLDFEGGYELTADGYSIKAVNGIVETEKDVVDEESGKVKTEYQYWRVYINGDSPKEGRQSEVIVKSGDLVEFKFVSGETAREDNGETTAANLDDAE